MSGEAMARWASAERVLCIRLDNLGDLLMTTPALRALKAARPGRRLTVLTSKSAAHAAGFIPEIDQCIAYDAPWHRRDADAGFEHDAETLERVRHDRYDAAVIFTVYSQSPLPSALFCRMTGIALVAAHCRENPYALLSDWIRETEPEREQRHEVQRQLDLVSALGATTADPRLSMSIPPATQRRVARKLAAMGVDPRMPWILIHPGSTAASRRYPPTQFAAAARLLYRRLGVPIVFGGSASEVMLVERVRRAMGAPSFSIAGELTLGECAASIALARVLIANNSGPVHIAAALGTPVVDLYALTNPQHTPWRVPHRVLFHDVPCRWCYRSVCPQGHHACLREVAPAQVVDAALQLLDARSGASTALPEVA